MRFIKGEGPRFLIAGIINTAITYLIYILLLKMWSYLLAFSISFVLGILSAFLLQSVFVFHSLLEWRKFFQFSSIYVFQYFIGLGLLSILVEYFELNTKIAPIINIIVLTPMTFVLNRWLILKKGK